LTSEGKRILILGAGFGGLTAANLKEPPSKESYKKKLDFERSRLNEWLLL
jgi:hypothetical protein